MKCRPSLCAGLLLAALAPLAQAVTLSYFGRLDPANPNDVFLTSFTLGAAGPVAVQTFGFGGGTNGAGQSIAAGGFDPYVSLFSGAGPGATFVASNDDGLCPPGRGAPACADSTLAFASLAAGSYTLALTLPFNFSFAENYGRGTLGDGFIGLDTSYSDGACAGSCSSAYAVDITYGTGVVVGVVPEPSTWALSALGLAVLGAARARRGR